VAAGVAGAAQADKTTAAIMTTSKPATATLRDMFSLLG
jgi:hypothetical protein